MFTYAAAFGLGLASQTFDREHERREQRARLEAWRATRNSRRSRASSAALPPELAQLDPRRCVDDEPAQARRMIGRLSSLLHTVFEGLDEPFVPLERELGMVRDYLEVERIRFGERLRSRVDGGSGAEAAGAAAAAAAAGGERREARHRAQPGAGTVRVTRTRAAARLHDSHPTASTRRTGRRAPAAASSSRAVVFGPSTATSGRASGPGCGGFAAMLDLPVRAHVV